MRPEAAISAFRVTCSLVLCTSGRVTHDQNKERLEPVYIRLRVSSVSCSLPLQRHRPALTMRVPVHTVLVMAPSCTSGLHRLTDKGVPGRMSQSRTWAQPPARSGWPSCCRRLRCVPAAAAESDFAVGSAWQLQAKESCQLCWLEHYVLSPRHTGARADAWPSEHLHGSRLAGLSPGPLLQPGAQQRWRLVRALGHGLQHSDR